MPVIDKTFRHNLRAVLSEQGATMRSVADRFQVQPQTVRVWAERSDLMGLWRKLPTDNAFSTKNSARVPGPSMCQEEVDNLVVRAKAACEAK